MRSGFSSILPYEYKYTYEFINLMSCKTSVCMKSWYMWSTAYYYFFTVRSGRIF